MEDKRSCGSCRKNCGKPKDSITDWCDDWQPAEVKAEPSKMNLINAEVRLHFQIDGEDCQAYFVPKTTLAEIRTSTIEEILKALKEHAFDNNYNGRTEVLVVDYKAMCNFLTAMKGEKNGKRNEL